MIIWDYTIKETEIIGIGPLLQRAVSDGPYVFIRYEFDLILKSGVVTIKSVEIDYDDLKNGVSHACNLSNTHKIQHHRLFETISKKFKPKVAKPKTIQC